MEPTIDRPRPPTAILGERQVPSPDRERRSGDGRGPALLEDDGASTAEYAITVLAACGFAAMLVAILSSDQVRSLLLGIITSALGMGS